MNTEFFFESNNTSPSPLQCFLQPPDPLVHHTTTDIRRLNSAQLVESGCFVISILWQVHIPTKHCAASVRGQYATFRASAVPFATA